MFTQGSLRNGRVPFIIIADRFDIWTKQIASAHKAFPSSVPCRNNMSRREPAMDERAESVAQNVSPRPSSVALVNLEPITILTFDSCVNEDRVPGKPNLEHMSRSNSSTVSRILLCKKVFLKEELNSFLPNWNANGRCKPTGAFRDDLVPPACTIIK